MRTTLLVVMLALLTAARPAAAQSGEGDYGGTGRNSLFKAVADVHLTEVPGQLAPFDPGFEISGSLIFTSRTNPREKVTGSVRGEIDPLGGVTGSVSYRDDNGRLRRVQLAGEFNQETGILKLNGRSGAFGRFEIVLDQEVDISGVWVFTNDPAGPMTIMRSNRKKRRYIGTYSGTGAHAQLHGTLKGVVAGENWSGQFHVEELGNIVDGKFDCEFNSGRGLTSDQLECEVVTSAVSHLSLRRATGP